MASYDDEEGSQLGDGEHDGEDGNVELEYEDEESELENDVCEEEPPEKQARTRTIRRMSTPERGTKEKAVLLGVSPNALRRMVRAGMPVVFLNMLFLLCKDMGPPVRSTWCVEYCMLNINSGMCDLF